MKRINDCIHGLIDVPSYCLIFIDTPVFQRLRNLMQLGLVSWVYPTAVHHRFEHSLGTGYLARLLMLHLREDKKFGMKITEEDIKCAELAGLLHDIGHGPFSHVWDRRVVSALGIKDYKHELASIDIIDWMIKEYDLKKRLDAEGLTSDHIRVIKEMIFGVLPGKSEKYYKKGNFKEFMYDIISNSYCELDVDKFDYLARDGKMLGTFSLESTTDLQRLIRFTTVYENAGHYHLAWRNVAAMTVLNVFQIRHRLHRIAYQHKNAIAVELMTADAITKANDIFGFIDSYSEVEENVWKLNIKKYILLTDHIFWQILYSTDDNLAESRGILMRITERKLYMMVEKTTLESKGNHTQKADEEAIRKIIMESRDRYKPETINKALDSVIIVHCSFDYAMKDKNPMDKCLFVDREGKLVPQDSVLSSMVEPKKTSDLEIRLYSRNNEDDVVKCLKNAFKMFCETFSPEPTEM